MKKLFSIMFIFVCAGKILAGEPMVAANDDFAAANKLYAEGKFAGAATAYETMLGKKALSSSLLFNYGNAEFKSGNLGKAIAAFRRAKLLAPRDSEIRANLNFVRNQIQGSTVRESRWQNWLGNFSLNEWTNFAVIAFWVTFILLAARQIRPALVPKFRGATNALILLMIILISIFAVQSANHFSNQTAIIISPQAEVRSGPFDDAQNAFAVHDGAELRVLDCHDDWVQVADSTGKTGWLQTKQVEILPGA
jgi:tetratricopeptide (TPR) repeat protein